MLNLLVLNPIQLMVILNFKLLVNASIWLNAPPTIYQRLQVIHQATKLMWPVSASHWFANDKSYRFVQNVCKHTYPRFLQGVFLRYTYLLDNKLSRFR